MRVSTPHRSRQGGAAWSQGAPPQVIPWGYKAVAHTWGVGSQLIVVACQVLAVVGGLAAHKHVPVTEDLGLAQTPILEGGSEGSRGD